MGPYRQNNIKKRNFENYTLFSGKCKINGSNTAKNMRLKPLKEFLDRLYLESFTYLEEFELFIEEKLSLFLQSMQFKNKKG